MTTIDAFNVISSDVPVTDPLNDELGYASFAKHLAVSIQQISSPQGFVFAINGAWGLERVMNFGRVF